MTFDLLRIIFRINDRNSTVPSCTFRLEQNLDSRNPHRIKPIHNLQEVLKLPVRIFCKQGIQVYSFRHRLLPTGEPGFRILGHFCEWYHGRLITPLGSFVFRGHQDPQVPSGLYAML